MTAKSETSWQDGPRGGVIRRVNSRLWMARPKNTVGMSNIRTFDTRSAAVAYAAGEAP